MNFKSLIAGVGLLFSVWLFPAASGWAEGKKIYLSQTTGGANFLSAHIADKKGFFKSEGLDLERVVVRASNISIAGMLAADIDYAILFSAVARAAMRGLPVRLVLLIMERPDYDLVSRPEITRIEQLNGKSMAVNTIGAASDVVTRLILEGSGLVPDRDVRLLPIASTVARKTALEKGWVAAALVTLLDSLSLERQGYKILIKAADMPLFPFMGVGTTVKIIQDRPDEVKGMIKAFLRANRFLREERAQTVPLIMEWAQMERENAERYYQTVWPLFSANGEPRDTDMKLVIDLAKKDLGMKGEIPVSQVADFTLLKAARRELGIR
jgi:NitT/TauT family transport system substrate-binding protein